MKRSVSHLLMLLLIALVSVCVLGYDLWISWSLQNELLLTSQKQQVERIFDRIYKASTNESQLKWLLDRFHARASQILLEKTPRTAKKEIGRLYRNMLADFLPQHDLMLWTFDPFLMVSKPVFKHSGGFGFAGPVATALIRRMYLPSLHQSRLPELKKGMTDALLFPLAKSLLGTSMGKGLQVFNSYEGRRGMYFKTFPDRLSGNWDLKNYLAAVLDVKGIPETFWVKTIVRTTGRKTFGVGFIPTGGGMGYFSSYFKDRPEMRQSIIALLKAKPGPGLFADLVPDHLVLIGQECGQNPLRPVVVYPVGRISELQNRHAILFLGALLFICGGIGLLTRIPRMPIGLVLVLVFTLITALPIFGVRTISRFIVSEENRRGEQEASRKLHDNLKDVDRETLFRQSSLSRIMRKVSRDPSIEKQLHTEFSSGKELGVAFAIVDRLQRSRPWCERYQGFYLVVGPMEFSRFWNTAINRIEDQERPDILRLLKPAVIKGLEVLQEKNTGKVNRPLGDSKTPSKKDIEYEMIKDFMGKGLGNEMGYNLIHFPNRIQSIRMNVGQLFIIIDPLYFNGYPEFLNLWGWDEAIFADAYRTQFRDRWNPMQPLYYVKVNSQQLLSYPRGMEKIPLIGSRLFELTRQSRDNNLAALRSQVVVGTQTVVLETLPGILTDTLFSGARFVGDPSHTTREMFRHVMTGSFVFAILLAFFAMAFFMAPLNRILRAIRMIGPGKYDVTLEDTDRGDEFGTLAQAFNTMMSGLKEKDLLGKYVSDSVRQLVSVGGIQGKARKGEQRMVSVLFSAISGFEEYQAERTPQEIFKLMNDHLAAMASAVKAGGGEISKVMGEKIMVVFDHAGMGGDEKTSGSLLEVIRQLKNTVRELGFEVEIGLNTGSVIAGILGSPAVRLDYTVIGDTVNLASRLAVLAHTTDASRVVISGATLDLLQGKATAKRLPFKKVKGKTQAVEVFLLDLV